MKRDVQLRNLADEMNSILSHKLPSDVGYVLLIGKGSQTEIVTDVSDDKQLILLLRNTADRFEKKEIIADQGPVSNMEMS